MSRRAGPSAWFWLLAPPAAVVASLLIIRNVFAVFAIYHLGFCLLLPLLVNTLRRRLTLSGHLHALGLTGPGTGRALTIGLALAILFAGGTLAAFQLWGHLFLENERAAAALAAWGVGSRDVSLVFWFMALVNGPAEELYWRGFVHAELVDDPRRVGVLVLTAACYATYHGVTVFLLLSSWLWSGAILALIWSAGLFWSRLRETTGSVWPPLLAHAGAAAAYMIAARPLLKS